MNDFTTGYTEAKDKAKEGIDPGLRNFMLGVYRKLALGLVVAGALAFAVARVPILTEMMFSINQQGYVTGYSLAGWAVIFAPLVLILFSNRIARTLNPAATAMLYWA